MTRPISSTTSVVNYSLRQNKTIERAIVFEGLARLYSSIALTGQTYIGFGSVWFTDFDLAHRLLGIETMLSIEMDEVTYKRALFNRLYRTLEVVQGDSADIVPTLLQRSDLERRPWIVWLDFDKELDESRLEELKDRARDLPEDSVLLTTFSTLPTKYAKKSDLRKRIEFLFGRGVAPKASNSTLSGDYQFFSNLVSEELGRSLVSEALGAGRPAALKAFQLSYRDSSPMSTIGIFLPSRRTRDAARNLIDHDRWPGVSHSLIQAPPLTAKEVQALRSELPAANLDRAAVHRLGFDLTEEQLTSFAAHYLRYPTFAQIS